MISEEISLNLNESKLKYFSLISIRSEQKSKIPMKGAHHRRNKKTPLPSTKINESHASDQYANEREQSLLVWLNKMEIGDPDKNNLPFLLD